MAKAKPSPITEERAAELLADIGVAQREREHLNTRMERALAKVKADFEEAAKPLTEEIEEKLGLVHEWAEEHRDEILDGDSKTYVMASGEISWRDNPAKVTITDANAVVAALVRLKLNRFVRTKQEVDKQAILGERDGVIGVRGIKITYGETFYAKPFASDIELSRLVKPAKAAS